MNLDQELGWQNSKRWSAEHVKIMGDTLSTIEDLIYGGNAETVQYFIKKEEDRYQEEGTQYKHWYQKHKSVLHLATMCSNLAMVSMLLTQCQNRLLNVNDYVTGFTPLHMALFVQNLPLMWYLIRNGADPTQLDKFDATPMDYARIMGIMPDFFLRNKHKTTFTVYEHGKYSEWPLQQFEQQFSVTWTPYFRCDSYYIEELLFSGFTVSEKNMDFREKYLGVIFESSGEENLVLGRIDEVVGFGVYAKKDFKEGDFIVRYGGFIGKEREDEDTSYRMTSGLEGVVLDSKLYRNLGGFVNHSKHPNAEATCIFTKGVEQAIVIATRPIAAGEQIFLDYSECYGEDLIGNFVDFGQQKTFPNCLPL
uniref:SET domain-containing protein n=1 Tax=Arcella intermedia TaxID=1963864 RepID=A0A6B2L7K5_9EUKA